MEHTGFIRGKNVMATYCNITTCQMTIRVRYYEVDRQNAVHHSVFARYFEMGRTELLRINGCDYKSLEDSGLVLVVARLDCRFRSPAHYDDELLLTTSTGKVDRVRLEHLYRVLAYNSVINSSYFPYMSDNHGMVK